MLNTVIAPKIKTNNQTEIMVVIEPICKDFQHSNLNREYLVLLQKLKQPIDFYASPCHIDAIKQNFTENPDTRLKPQKFKLDRGIYSILSNVITFKKIFSLQRQSKSRILLLSCNNSLLLAAKIAAANRPVKLAIILHGFIASLGDKKNRVTRQLTRFVLSLGNVGEKFKYIVLSNNVFDNLISEAPKLKRHLIKLYPPIPADGKLYERVNTRQGQITVGTAGVFSKNKGSEKFLNLAIRYKNDKRFRFVYLGTIPKSEKTRLVTNGATVVEIQNSSDLNYHTAFSQFDIVAFFHDRNFYKFGLSGVFIDAIANRKPIFALRSQMFEEFFQGFGQLGWQFNNDEEIYQSLPMVYQEINGSAQKQIRDRIDQLATHLNAQNLIAQYAKAISE